LARTWIRKRNLTVMLALIFWSAAVGLTGAAGVRPLVIEMDVRPGDVRDFEIALIPGSSEGMVDLTLYEPVQLLSGGLVYKLPENQAFSATSWVTLDNYTVRVYPDQESKVAGRVRVPFSASGSHTVIIMVEPRPPEMSSGITFQVRYAVRLSIRVERPGLRQTAELEEFSLEPGDNGQPIVRAVVKNTSAWDYLVEGEVTVRDAERRLVERITLVSPAASNAETQATRLYPGARVEFLGEVTKRLLPGEYSLRLYFRYGNQGQIVRNEVISISEGDFHFPNAERAGAFSLIPETIEYAAIAGERKSHVLEFVSEIADSVRIVAEPRSTDADYKYSSMEWVQLRMAGNEFELPGRRRTRLGLTIAVPRDTADGSYHGNIVVQAYDLVTQELLAEKTVPISVFVGEKFDRTVELRAISYGSRELVIDLYNAGNVVIHPQAEVMIRNSSGDFVGRAELTLPEGEKGILPLRRQRLEGRTPFLEPDSYELEVTVRDGATELLVVTKEIEVL